MNMAMQDDLSTPMQYPNNAVGGWKRFAIDMGFQIQTLDKFRMKNVRIMK